MPAQIDTYRVVFWTGGALCRVSVQAFDWSTLIDALTRQGVLFESIVSIERVPHAR